MTEFQKDLEALINKHSLEQESDTPDAILAEFVGKSLDAFDLAVNRREVWYGRPQSDMGDMTPAEAAYGILVWLTTRDESITFGATHDSAPAALLVAKFCEAHGLGDVRDSWPQSLVPEVSAA